MEKLWSDFRSLAWQPEYEYSEKDDKYYAVLHRLTKFDPTDPCLFCNEKHLHGVSDGHRSKHCSFSKNVIVQLLSNVIIESDDGYIVKTRFKSKRNMYWLAKKGTKYD